MEISGTQLELELEDALSLKRAEVWLEVKEPLLALKELKGLPVEVWEHPWAKRLLDAASIPYTPASRPVNERQTAKALASSSVRLLSPKTRDDRVPVSLP